MAFDILYLYHAEKNLSTQKKEKGQDSRFSEKSENARRKRGFEEKAKKGKESNCRLKRRYFMLAKKFRLPIRPWMKDKNKKVITKKGNFFIVKVLPNNLGFSRFGAIIGLRAAKKAFRRNYLKRIIFDFIRLNNFHLRPGKDFLIIVSPVAGESAKADVEKELNLLLS